MGGIPFPVNETPIAVIVRQESAPRYGPSKQLRGILQTAPQIPLVLQEERHESSLAVRNGRHHSGVYCDCNHDRE